MVDTGGRPPGGSHAIAAQGSEVHAWLCETDLKWARQPIRVGVCEVSDVATDACAVVLSSNQATRNLIFH